MSNRFPGYSTLAKRDTVSWNDATRKSVGKRMDDPPPRRFFTEQEWPILIALCDRIVPQTQVPKVPIANFIDQKMAGNHTDGYQEADLPPMQEMWRRGLAGLDAEARLRFKEGFAALLPARQDQLLHAVQAGDVRAPEWSEVSAKSFFKTRVLHDIPMMFYGQPQGWDEMGFGGPASPRGYVRMGFDRHDPWDAVERKPGEKRNA